MRETYYRAVRGQNMSFDVGTKCQPTGIAEQTNHCLRQTNDRHRSTHADEYKAIIARLNRKQPADYQVTASHTHYFRGDYSLHVRPSITLTYVWLLHALRNVNTATKKTWKPISCPTDVPILRKLEMNTLTSSGMELVPIPGTTAPQLEKVPMDPKAWGVLGTSHIRRRSFRQHLWSYSIRLYGHQSWSKHRSQEKLVLLR